MSTPTSEAGGAGRYHLPGAPEGLGPLIRGIMQDLQEMLRDEIQLGKAELKEDAGTIGRAGGMLGAASLFSLVGFIFIMLALVYLLSKVLPNWLAAGIVGLALAITGAILGLLGKDQLSTANLKPEQTIESLKEDKAWAQEQIEDISSREG
jgi:uncharacterized membrane protein YqjE